MKAKRVFFGLLLGLVLAAWPGPVRAEAGPPFAAGEKLSYDIYWTFIHAGRASLEVLADEELKGVPVRHYRARAKSTPFVDAFYRLRDNIEAYTDLAVTRSLLYDKDQEEGDYRRKVTLDFDWDRGLVYRYKQGELKMALLAPDGALDPLSMLYAFRAQPLYVGYEFKSRVTDGKKIEMGVARVVGREKVETPMGEFDAFLVEPHLEEVGTVFRTSPGARLQVWITADERRIPVKVKSKVSIGHFSIEITGIEPGLGPRDLSLLGGRGGPDPGP
ncbi:MAG: DUF3108 domain-containing protein [Desulfovibrionaceae bacterium]|nr:DUF3108 domain-containing protein [Desulfovibrionaceae bacterium]MDD4951602.1 DUF3108 domain-containing protein [Desulfovibrionaceae bacterium]